METEVLIATGVGYGLAMAFIIWGTVLSAVAFIKACQ